MPWLTATARRRRKPVTRRNFAMTAANMIQVVDRFALTLMNAIVFVGLPLVALGVVAQGL